MSTRTPALVRAQNEYKRRNLKEKGLTRATIWVPRDYADELKKIAADMRSGRYVSVDNAGTA